MYARTCAEIRTQTILLRICSSFYFFTNKKLTFLLRGCAILMRNMDMTFFVQLMPIVLFSSLTLYDRCTLTRTAITFKCANRKKFRCDFFCFLLSVRRLFYLWTNRQSVRVIHFTHWGNTATMTCICRLQKWTDAKSIAPVDEIHSDDVIESHMRL